MANRVDATTLPHKGDMTEYKKPLKLRLKEGALRKQLKVKEGENIPEGKLEVKSSDSALTKKRKQFAINAAKWHH